MKARYDISFMPERSGYQSSGENIYKRNQKYFRAGAYWDLYPIEEDGLYISGGFSFNKIETSYSIIGNSSSSINGKIISTNMDDLGVYNKIPTLTPYIGAGYEIQNKINLGWSGGIRLGFLLGNYKTTATSKLNGVGGITINDLVAEVDKSTSLIRNQFFHPELLMGFSYKF